jgi:opacity protein-like surface antigen
MKKLTLAALVSLFAANVAFAADAPAAPASDCEAKAIGKNGKPLAGAAKGAFMKKCEANAAKPAAAGNCEEKAIGKNGKPLAGAAKAAFMKKCEAGK